MKYLYLLRHAKSSWDPPGVADRERALNARGIRACGLLANHFRECGIVPSVVWCSTARRTRETLERIFVRAGWDLTATHINYADDLYLASPDTIAAHVRLSGDQAGSVLVVGHNPGIAELARSITGKDPSNLCTALEHKYPTGGLATFVYPGDRWDGLTDGSCTLRSFITPRDLEDQAVKPD